MTARSYLTNPKEVYLLELQKLQLSFSEIQRVGEEVSQLESVSWTQVERLRHMNFILLEAFLTVESLLTLPGPP